MKRVPPDEKPGPVKTWAEMTPEERQQVASTAKPPSPPAVLPFRCIRGDGEARQSVTVEIEAVQKVRESDLAVLYVLDLRGGSTGQVWIPKSNITEVDGEDAEGLHPGAWGATDGPVLLAVKRWWAEREELIP